MSTTETLPFTTAPSIDPYKLGHDGRRRRPDDGGAGRNYSTGHGEGGPASKRVIVAYGFWLFLLSDIVMFSACFAAHAVLRSATAGGPSGHELFDPRSIVIETSCLLLSSFTCGLSAVAASVRSQLWTQCSLLITGILGLAFLAFEARHFLTMIAHRPVPHPSPFLPSFSSA